VIRMFVRLPTVGVPGRLRRLALVPLMAIGLTLGLWVAPGAQAAVLLGNDVSWPQCPTSVGGYGAPMPPESTQFVVVGLTKGLPFTENPCLASQVTWFRDRAKPAQAYTMAGFPTSAQLTAYGSSGPWRATTRAAQLSNVGYAEARYAVGSLAKVGWRPPVVWVDVEPRPAQPWPSTATAQRLDNRYVIEGLMRGLREAGYPYGVYSNASGWQAITGSWWLPGVPVWATAGTLDYPTEALDRCTQASFSGGKVYLSQWWDTTRDYDRTCGTYSFTALPMPASTLSNSTGDFNGDWRNDVLARWSTGSLRLYPGTGLGALALSLEIGRGWGIFNVIDTAGDVSGDGTLDVVARSASTGELLLYKGNGRGGWNLPAVVVGRGWNIFNAIVGLGDFNGDQRPDLLARRASDGNLYLYAGTGSGGWRTAVLIGRGWNVMNALVGTGDFNGDGRADLLARERATGYLWLYPGNGSGGFAPPVQVGTVYNGLTVIAAVGDLNGDRTADLVGRDSAGNLWLYPGTGSGGLGARSLLGTGWNIATAIL